MSKHSPKIKFFLKNIGLMVAAVIVFTATLLAAVYLYRGCPSPVTDDDQPAFLYVQTAHSGTLSAARSDGQRTLTLNNVSPVTVYFAERPNREAGHQSTEEFIGQWDEGEDSFETNPPNAALDIISEDSQTLAVVELMNARYDASTKTLEYDLIILDDETDEGIPETFDEAALFIDSIWKEYYCNCEPKPGSNSCNCTYKYNLGRSDTKEFRGFCKKDVTRPIGIGITGRKKSTTCTIRIFQDVPYVTRSCTNWSPTSSDELNIKVKCKNYE